MAEALHASKKTRSTLLVPLFSSTSQDILLFSMRKGRTKHYIPSHLHFDLLLPFPSQNKSRHPLSHQNPQNPKPLSALGNGFLHLFYQTLMSLMMSLISKNYLSLLILKCIIFSTFKRENFLRSGL